MSPGRLRDPSRGPAPALVGPPGSPAGGDRRRTGGPTASSAAEPTGHGPTGRAPLAGRTVLVPRPPERAAALASTLAAAGARVLVSPAVERVPIEDTAAVDDAVRSLVLGRFDWVVVTSVNAIAELVASARRLDVDLAGNVTADAENVTPGAGNVTPDAGNVTVGVRWAAVGPATRRALEEIGIRVDLEPTENSARGLLAAFGELGPDAGADGAHGAAGAVLLPQGDLAAPTMADGLRALGRWPHPVTVYRTVAHDLAPDVVAAWHAGEVDAVVLTSGSVAREVARQLGPRPDVAGVAIGEPTARAARAVGLRLDAVAATATDDALAAALLTTLSGAGPGAVADGPAAAHDTPAHPPSDPSTGDPS